jgi:hypothetical protein
MTRRTSGNEKTLPKKKRKRRTGERVRTKPKEKHSKTQTNMTKMMLVKLTTPQMNSILALRNLKF